MGGPVALQCSTIPVIVHSTSAVVGARMLLIRGRVGCSRGAVQLASPVPVCFSQSVGSSMNLGGGDMSARYWSSCRQTRAARTRRHDVQLTNGSWDAEHGTDRFAACRIIHHHGIISGPSQHLLTIREVVRLDDEAAAEESSRRSRRAQRRRTYVDGSCNHSPNSLRASQITFLHYLQVPAGRSAGGMRRGIRAGG